MRFEKSAEIGVYLDRSRKMQSFEIAS
jgi:hypothetical protein